MKIKQLHKEFIDFLLCKQVEKGNSWKWYKDQRVATEAMLYLSAKTGFNNQLVKSYVVTAFNLQNMESK